MPDGDIVHNKLRAMYQEPYKILCQGKWDAVESEISANFSNQKQILALHLAVVQ